MTAVRYLVVQRVIRSEERAVEHRVRQPIGRCRTAARLLQDDGARRNVPRLQVVLVVGVDGAWRLAVGEWGRSS